MIRPGQTGDLHQFVPTSHYRDNFWPFLKYDTFQHMAPHEPSEGPEPSALALPTVSGGTHWASLAAPIPPPSYWEQ